MIRVLNMLLKVLSAIVLVQSVQGGYDYPKPSVPFELLNNQGQAVEARSLDNTLRQDIQKTISYSVPYEEYFYLQQRKNNENTKNGIQTPDTINPAQQNLKISTLQHLTSFTPVTTELKANIDGIQSTVVQRPIVRELDSINGQPILNPVNDLHSLQNGAKIVPSVANLQNTGSQILNLENVQTIDSNLLKTSGNVPSALNFESYVPNLVSAERYIPPVLNLRDSHASNINVQAAGLLIPETVVNVQQPLLNLQNTNNVNQLKYNQFLADSIPLQQSDSQFFTNEQNTFTSNYNAQNSESYVNIGTSQLSSNLNGDIPQLLTTQNNLPPINYQSDRDQVLNVQNIAEPVITKDISYHVPPPEIEEAPVAYASLPPKKIYKILFIKLPAQESKNNVNLQSALYNQSPIDEKTIIYLLVKKPELSDTVVLPQTKVSDHEVLFVNYKEKPNIDPALINKSLIRDSSAENVLNSSLEPGLTNGY